MVQAHRSSDHHIAELAQQLYTHGICPTSDQQAQLFLLADATQAESRELEQLVDKVVEGGVSRKMNKTLLQLADDPRAHRSAIRDALRHLSRQMLGLPPSMPVRV